MLLAVGRRIALCAALALWVLATPAAAVIISEGDGTGNTTSDGFFGWDYVGRVNLASGTYLGGGWVLTAAHVGMGDFELDGTVYPHVPGSQVQLQTNPSNMADLMLFAVSPAPSLPPLEIRTSPPPINEFLVMIGYGRDRGSATSWNGLDGWNWAPTITKRWGTNEVESLTTGLVLGTISFFVVFDDDPVLPEAHPTAGDSGGAIFSLNPQATQLAGVMYAEAPSPGQPANTALFTNLAFSARLDFYRDDIIAVTGTCGNAIIESVEQCDDGNMIAGDGCDLSCQNEVAVPALPLGAWLVLAVAFALVGGAIVAIVPARPSAPRRS